MSSAALPGGKARAAEWLAYAGVLGVGAALYVACRFYPADLPLWMPWEFSWPAYLATVLTLGWLAIGLRRLPKAERPPAWRSILFVTGVLLLYAMVQTHIDYFAQHMFFVHRAQHFILHHVGAFLIALGASGPVLWAGMPDFLKPVFRARPVRGFVDFMMHPVVAPVLFVGMIYFWLIPQIHTRVMLDANLYELMNWTMAVDGIFFWCLILDARPKPPARLGYGIRALLIIAVEPPQMVVGAVLSLSATNYYPVYEICGRIIDIPGLSDQHYGGLIIWLPGTLLSLLAIIIVLINLRLHEESAEHAQI